MITARSNVTRQLMELLINVTQSKNHAAQSLNVSAAGMCPSSLQERVVGAAHDLRFGQPKP
jgi:hypothetical protein